MTNNNMNKFSADIPVDTFVEKNGAIMNEQIRSEVYDNSMFGNKIAERAEDFFYNTLNKNIGDNISQTELDDMLPYFMRKILIMEAYNKDTYLQVLSNIVVENDLNVSDDIYNLCINSYDRDYLYSEIMGIDRYKELLPYLSALVSHHLSKNMKDIPSDIAQIVNDNFWNLI